MNKLIKTAAVASAFFAATLASALEFDYSNLEGSSVVFNGDGSFTFDSDGGNDFHITNGAGDLVGLEGNITGTYWIGAGANAAPVSGSGVFSVIDGDGMAFTADIEWGTILRSGALSGLNYLAEVNLTNFAYAGSNGSLQQLLWDGSAINTLTFQFTAVGTLNQLRTVAQETSYSGTVTSVSSVPDGGTTAALLGLGLVGLSFLARRRAA